MVHLLIDRLVSSVPETDNKIFVLLEKYVRCVDKYLVDQETLQCTVSTDLSVDGPRVEVLGGAGEPEEAPGPRGVERLPVRGDREPSPAPALALAPLLPLLVQLHPGLKLLPLHLQ